MDQDKKTNEVLYYGSESLYSQVTALMKEVSVERTSDAQYDLFLFVHGHVHHEPGCSWLHRKGKRCCIVNPGSVMWGRRQRVRHRGGRYATLRIRKVGEEWKVTDVHHSFAYWRCLFVFS